MILKSFQTNLPGNYEYFEKDFEGELNEGLIVQGVVDDQQVVGAIIGINGENITVDFNHPLAGQTLTFDVKLLEIVD